MSENVANQHPVINPYSAPASLEGIVTPSEPEQSLQSIARKVFLAWEKLRLIYIAILAMITIFFVLIFLYRFTPPILQMIVEGAFAANLLYFAGPSIETYIRWLGYQKSWPRWFMFCGGTFLSMMLATAILFHNLAPNPNR